MSQTPRRIHTERSIKKPDPAASAPRPAAQEPAASGGYTEEPPRAEHAAPPRHAAPRSAPRSPEPSRRRKKKKRTLLWLPLAVTLVLIGVVAGGVIYAVSLVDRVEESLRPEEDAPSIQQEIQTAEEYKGDVVNILVCGIEIGRASCRERV